MTGLCHQALPIYLIFFTSMSKQAKTVLHVLFNRQIQTVCVSDCGLHTASGGSCHFEQHVVRQVREASLLTISIHFCPHSRPVVPPLIPPKIPEGERVDFDVSGSLTPDAAAGSLAP